MIFPVGTEKKARRFPRATVGLIVANLVVFFLAWPIEKDGAHREGAAFGRLIATEAEIESTFLGAPRSENPFVAMMPSRVRGATEREARFWRAFGAGRVLPQDHPTWQEWHDAQSEWQEALRSRLYYKWGVHGKTRNPLALITAMFLHFGFLHLFFNMLFLWAVGVNVEDVWGWSVFLAVYLASGVGAEVVHALLVPPSEVPGAGASGAVAGIMGAFLVRHWRMRIRFVTVIPLLPVLSAPAWVLLPLWAGVELRGALAGAEVGVAHWAHVGGFAFGAVLALALKAGGAEERLRPSLEAEERAVRVKKKEGHLRTAALHAERGDGAGYRNELRAAVEADPDDEQVCLRWIELLRSEGDAETARAETERLLERLWSRRRRPAFLGVLRRFEEAFPPPGLAPGLRFRAALALEADRPREAAELLWRLLRDAPEDPVVPSALKRYAALLDRLGDARGAAQVRARISARPDAGEPVA